MCVCTRWTAGVTHSLVCSMCSGGDRPVGNASFPLGCLALEGEGGRTWLSEPHRWPPGFWAPALVLSFSSGQSWFALAFSVLPCGPPCPGRETLLLMHQSPSTHQWVYLPIVKKGWERSHGIQGCEVERSIIILVCHNWEARVGVQG